MCHRPASCWELELWNSLKLTLNECPADNDTINHAIMVRLCSSSRILLMILLLDEQRISVVSFRHHRDAARHTDGRFYSTPTGSRAPPPPPPPPPNLVKAKPSRVLESILGDMSSDDFFEKVWQNQPKIVSKGVLGGNKDMTADKKAEKPEDPSFDGKVMESIPLEETIRQGWNVVTQLLDNAPLLDRNENNLELPVVMMDGNVQKLEEVMERYGTKQTLYSAFLDGCSIVQNHADLISPWIAALCHDLQNTFPYVFAQTYLTPPFSQTLNPHADDRDVIVIQILGEKEWQVYQEVPIPFPYPHEQVGKRRDLPVPLQVLDGPTSVSRTLRIGDVLYIPRGHVHQAFSSDDLSCHVTVAIATFDWSLGAAVHRLTQDILMQDMESRKSIIPVHNRDQLRKQLDRVMGLLKDEITIDFLEKNVMARADHHVQMDNPIRLGLLHDSAAYDKPIVHTTDTVGPEAASKVTWNTLLRAATSAEKESVNLKGQVGLFIRDDTKVDILAAAARFKDSNISKSVLELRSLDSNLQTNPYVCDLTLLAFAKQAVSLGALAVVE